MLVKFNFEIQTIAEKIAKKSYGILFAAPCRRSKNIMKS